MKNYNQRVTNDPDENRKILERAIAIHESAHFITYLKHCKDRNKGFHHINNLSIDGQPMFRTADINMQKEYHKIMLSTQIKGINDIQIKEIRAMIKNDIHNDIVYTLSGYAAELYDLIGRCPQNFALAIVLNDNFSSEYNQPDSDFEYATELISYLGKDKNNAHIRLLEFFRKAVFAVKSQWHIIIEIAEIVKEKRTISGDDLYNLAKSIHKRL